QEKAATGLDEHIRSLVSQLQDEASRQSAAARESMSSGTVETEKHIAELRNSLQEEAARQSTAVRDSLTNAATEAEQRIAGLRTSLQEQSQWLEAALGRAAEFSERLEHLSTRTESAQRQALAGFESQIDDVLSLHRNELHRQSETLLEEINARIRNTFDENSQLALSRFSQHVESMVQPHI